MWVVVKVVLPVLFVATFWINLYGFSTTKVQDVVTSTSAIV